MVNEVIIAFSWAFSPVSADTWASNAVLRLAVEVPTAELNAVKIELIAPNIVLESGIPIELLIMLALKLLEGVTLLKQVVIAVMIDFSCTVKLVSALTWEAKEAAKVAVETPVQEVKAVSTEAIALSVSLLSTVEAMLCHLRDADSACRGAG